MASVAGIDYTGALTVTSLTNSTININSNGAGPAFDVSPYIGNLMVITSCGAGVSGTVIVPSIKAGPSIDSSQGLNWVLNLPNFSTTAASNVSNVDLRSSSFVSANNKYIFMTWLITGSATANSSFTATVIGQKKVSS